MIAQRILAILKKVFCPPHLRNERGMLLVLVMMVMLVVSSLAAANLINAMLERNLAKNQNYASLALQAAEAGIADGVSWLNMYQALVPGAFPWDDVVDNPITPLVDESWPHKITRDLSRDFNGDGDFDEPGEKLGSYTVTMRFKREWRSYNDDNNDGVVDDDDDCLDAGESSGYVDGDAQTLADCPADIVLFNNAARTLDGGYGFTGALFLTAGSGFPVVEVDAVGQYGNAGYRQVLFDIARNRMNAQVEGAFTARSGVTAGGSSNIDGSNHDLSGTVAPVDPRCGPAKPGILVDDGVFTNDTNGNGVCDAGETHLPCDLNCDGDCGDAPAESCGNAKGTPCWGTHSPMAPPLEKTPWGVLGLPQGEFESMFTKREFKPPPAAPNTPDDVMNMPCSTDQYYVWFASTEGVKFNNSSTCNNYNGILVVHNEDFDPDQWEACAGTYCTDDLNGDGKLDHAPAVFDMNGNISWTGVVVADQVVKVNGTPVIRGGILSLASGGVIDTSITGNIDIEFSCEAVTGATSQGYKTRLNWHRIR